MYEKFKYLLEKNNVKPADVCRSTGISPQQITNWKKKGKGSLSAYNMQKLADYFHVDVHYFMLSTDDLLDIYSDDENEKSSETYKQIVIDRDIEENSRKYYENNVAEIAQDLFENEELRLLFDSARDADPEDLKTVHQMLLALKKKEKND